MLFLLIIVFAKPKKMYSVVDFESCGLAGELCLSLLLFWNLKMRGIIIKKRWKKEKEKIGVRHAAICL